MKSKDELIESVETGINYDTEEQKEIDNKMMEIDGLCGMTVLSILGEFQPEEWSDFLDSDGSLRTDVAQMVSSRGLQPDKFESFVRKEGEYDEVLLGKIMR